MFLRHFIQFKVYVVDFPIVSKLNTNITSIIAMMNWAYAGLQNVHLIERTIPKTALPQTNAKTKADATEFILISKQATNGINYIFDMNGINKRK